MLEQPSFSVIFLEILQFILSATFFLGPLVVCCVFGNTLRRKYQIPRWYYWTANVFLLPVIAAPLVYFACGFIDNPKSDSVEWTIILFNTYAFWLIGGYFLSLLLYRRHSRHSRPSSLLPSPLSWLCAIASIALGIAIIS